MSNLSYRIGVGRYTVATQRSIHCLSTSAKIKYTNNKLAESVTNLLTKTDIYNYNKFIILFKLILLSDFGDDHIQVLIRQFEANLEHAGVSVDEILPEWTALKAVLYRYILIDNT